MLLNTPKGKENFYSEGLISAEIDPVNDVQRSKTGRSSMVINQTSSKNRALHLAAQTITQTPASKNLFSFERKEKKLSFSQRLNNSEKEMFYRYQALDGRDTAAMVF